MVNCFTLLAELFCVRVKCKTDPINFFRFHFSPLIFFCSFQPSSFHVYSIRVFFINFCYMLWLIFQFINFSSKFFNFINFSSKFLN